jgi:hypothetical protein
LPASPRRFPPARFGVILKFPGARRAPSPAQPEEAMPRVFAVRLFRPWLLAGLLLSWGAPARAEAGEPRWVEGYEAGLREAARRQRPAFVYFDANWCSWCQQYKQGSLSDAGVRERLTRDYVAVRVDFDARPDLVLQYRVRGLPYTLILDARGARRAGFIGILAPADLRDLLDSTARAPAAATRTAPTEVAARVRALDRAGYAEFRRAWLQHVERLYDARAGTLLGRFPTGATLKRPSPLTWLYLHEHGLWPERVARAARVERARLADPVDGGFFNFLDPAQPGGDYLESSKLLEGNAWLLLWQAVHGREDRHARRAADDAFQYLRRVLWDVQHGGFWQAQQADAGYYGRPPARRRESPTPPLDRIKRADTNAQAVIALLRYGEVRGRPEAAALAALAFDRVLEALLHDGRLYHARRDGERLTPGQPLGLFWLLAAGAELERRQADAARRARIDTLVALAREWIERERRRPGASPAPELAGLIAWVAGQPGIGPRLPAGTRDWALRQLRVEADTPPDDLVYGLRAWEERLVAEGAPPR